MPPFLFGISGVARAGKDTFARYFKHEFLERQTRAVTIAFADALKEELMQEMLDRYSISTFTTKTEEKAIIRPHLVAHGRLRREESYGTYLIDRITPRVEKWLAAGTRVIVTDVRYANEAAWIHSLGGKVIYIERVLEDGTLALPANPEEAENDPKARAAADLIVNWPTEKSLDMVAQRVQTVWSQVAI